MLPVEVPSGALTLLFTDIQGSTALWESDPEEMNLALQRHDKLLHFAIEAAGGYVFKTVGDAFCVAFSTPEAGVDAVLLAQRALGAELWPEPIIIRVRMALHSGECQERHGDYFGPTVNRTARLEAVAHGGQVLLSESTALPLLNRLPESCDLLDLGQHRLKDLGRPEHVFQLCAPGLDRSFPPLRSLDNPELEHNLPVQLTSFVGRERELLEIHHLVDEGRLVTLAGPGGSGKTRLALQVAAELLDGSADGVWLADFSALSAEEQVAREVASVLGVREESTRPLLETLSEVLQYRNVLLVMDNCEHVIDACAKLAETVVRACPKVWVLATSRESLGVEGERVYRVPPLGLPDVSEAELDPEAVASAEAVRLFVERAREHRPEFSLDAANASTIVSLCRHLDGIPLALELAAARVRYMSVSEVESRLSQRFRLLSARSRTRGARQQTLEGAVAWSYELLIEPEKLLFATLSVFPGGFGLATAESVCSKAAALDEFEVVPLVESLVEKSLLQTEQGPSDLGYRMLETIRHYAADRLMDLGTDATNKAREAHALYYLGVAEEAAHHLVGPNQAEWMARLEADLDDLRTGLSFFIDSAEHGVEALRMVGALRYFWEMLGTTPGEARDLSLAALAHREARSPSKERSAALLSCGSAQSFLGDFVAARAFFEEGALIAAEIGDAALLADHLTGVAYSLYRLGEYDRMKETADRAVQIAAEVGDPTVLARAHDRRALADLDMMDDPESARGHYATALRLVTRAGNKYRMAAVYNNLANFEMTAGHLTTARSHLEASLEHAFTDDLRAITHENLGSVNLLEGITAKASTHYREGLRLAVRSGYGREIPYGLIGLAMCATASQYFERAATLHGAADATLQGALWEPLESRLPRPRHRGASGQHG